MLRRSAFVLLFVLWLRSIDQIKYQEETKPIFALQGVREETISTYTLVGRTVPKIHCILCLDTGLREYHTDHYQRYLAPCKMCQAWKKLRG